ncbi:MAG TPA: hypothetical protein VF285_11315 [Castellaniella sp.]|uniref:hypothetical protein n=1 Tax=Castellaniella sp. TaxID=1955812 RepID=UPI002F1747FA
MDIKQAIERVRAIDERLDSIKSFVNDGCHDGGSVEITYGSRRIKVTALFTATEKRELIEAEAMRLQAERTKLAGVIDMANAALKGIGA